MSEWKLNVAVCDDIEKDSAQIADMTARLLQTSQVAHDIARYASAAAILDDIRGGAKFHILILDVMMENVSGYQVLQTMRAWGDHTPVMMLSGKSDEMDQVLGLGFGADSYLTKPFHTSVLIQTAKALIRRNQIYSQASEARIHKGPFAVDTLKMECLKNGVSLNFTAREQALFRFLLEHPGQVFTKAQLYSQVWNEAVVDDNTITVYIKRIRSKIEENPKEPKYLKTIRGIGYMLEV